MDWHEMNSTSRQAVPNSMNYRPFSGGAFPALPNTTLAANASMPNAGAFGNANANASFLQPHGPLPPIPAPSSQTPIINRPLFNPGTELPSQAQATLPMQAMGGNAGGGLEQSMRGMPQPNPMALQQANANAFFMRPPEGTGGVNPMPQPNPMALQHANANAFFMRPPAGTGAPVTTKTMLSMFNEASRGSIIGLLGNSVKCFILKFQTRD